MKKLSLLIALALLISIGGVYATWNYAGSAAEESHKHMSINLTDATQDTAEGVILNVINTMDIELDDAGNYNAKAVVTGVMGFVFTPNAGASTDVQESGISMQWELEQSETPMQYKGQPIFTINNPITVLGKGQEITDANATTLQPGHDLSAYKGSFYVSIDSDAVQDKLSVSLYLPTYADYEDFQKNSLPHGLVGITVSKVISGS